MRSTTPWMAAVCLGPLLAGCGEPGHHRESWDVSGATAAVEVYTRARQDAETEVAEIRAKIRQAMLELDPLAQGGELGRMNRRAADGFHDVANLDVYRCLKLALDYAKESEGAYDPTLGALLQLHAARGAGGRALREAEIDVALAKVGWPKVTLAPEAWAVQYRVPGLQIDLGQVARGCALDLAARTFARPGSLAGLLELGGVYRAWRAPPGVEAWTISVPDPRRPGARLLDIRVASRGLAAAAHPVPDAEQTLTPFLDGRTGRPAATDLQAVVALADSAADAAALSHAVFVAGSLQGPSFLARTRRTEAVLLVRGEGDSPSYLLASASLEGSLQLADEARNDVDAAIRYLLPPQTLDRR